MINFCVYLYNNQDIYSVDVFVGEYISIDLIKHVEYVRFSKH